MSYTLSVTSQLAFSLFEQPGRIVVHQDGQNLV
jgi:hypothetical protein